MRKLVILTVMLSISTSIAGPTLVQADNNKQVNIGTAVHHDAPLVYKANNKWITKWSKIDQSIWASNHIAAQIFGVSEYLLNDIVSHEGGNVNPTTLSQSLCLGYGKGWNYQGSYAFGAFQFMLSHKPACYNHSDWGTFACCDFAAFKAAKESGFAIPYRFKNPASNIGQAITASYMISHPSTGGLRHWGR